MYNSLVLIFCLIFCNAALAGVNLSKTRLVIDKESGYSGSVRVNNLGDEEVLIQSWLDDGKKKVSSGNILVSPPIRKLGGEKSAVLKVNLTGLLNKVESIDSELVYFLNVKVIPKRNNSSDTLLISTNSRIKVFVRPEALRGLDNEKEMLKGLKVNYNNGKYILDNGSNFSVNFDRISLGDSEFGGGMILPGGKFELRGGFENQIKLNLVNDFGARKEIEISVGNDV